MLAAVYWFSLIVGGGLAFISIFGDFLDGAEADFEGEPGGGFDGGADAAGDADVPPDAPGADLESGADATRILSLRGLIYGVFGFGLIGLALSWIAPERAALGLALAATGGLLASVLVTRTVDWLRTSEVGQVRADRTFVGRTGKVLVPIRTEVAGQIRVERGGRTHRLRALPHPSATSSDSVAWDEVVVLEVEGGIAYVSPPEDLGMDRLAP